MCTLQLHACLSSHSCSCIHNYYYIRLGEGMFYRLINVFFHGTPLSCDKHKMAVFFREK